MSTNSSDDYVVIVPQAPRNRNLYSFQTQPLSWRGSKQSSFAGSLPHTDPNKPVNDTQDTYYVTLMACYGIGVACVLPYASLMGSNDYFQLQFSGTDDNICAEIFMAYNVVNVITAITLIPLSSKVSGYWRFVFFALSFIGFTAILIIGSLGDDWIFVMSISSFAGLAVANMTGAALAYGEKFQDVEGFIIVFSPSFDSPQYINHKAIETYVSNLSLLFRYSNSVFVGRGLTSVLTCIARIGTKLLFEQKVGGSAFFAVSALVSLFALILFIISSRTAFSTTRNIVKKESKTEVEVSTVFKKIWFPAFIAFINMFITMLILPIFLIKVKSQYHELNETKWIALILTTLYSISNFCGRKFLIAKSISTSMLGKLSVVRLLLIAIALALYNELIINDLVLYCFTIVLGFSHGQFGCLAFTRYGPMLEKIEVETGSSWMYLLMMAGSSLAAFIGWMLHHIVHLSIKTKKAL